MTTLSNIRKRLSSLGNIKQIATSMEMVASARFRKAQEKAQQSHFYISKMQEILAKACVLAQEDKHPLFEQRSVKKIALLIITSDRGLCGAYNTNMLSVADNFLKNKSTENIVLLLLGKKAIQHYQHKQWSTVRSYLDWGGKITVAEIKELNEFIIKNFLDKQIDTVWVAYTKFVSLMERVNVLEQFLPLFNLKERRQANLNYLCEPNVTTLLEEMVPRYCLTKIQTFLNHAYASELAARIFSMKAAAKNAGEMVDQLTLEQNKLRQTSITRELLETTASTREL